MVRGVLTGLSGFAKVASMFDAAKDMKPADPYRSAALAVVPSHVEHAFCPWCSHSDNSRPLECHASSKRKPWGGRTWAEHVNPEGRCERFEPSLLTRIARRFGLRPVELLESQP